MAASKAQKKRQKKARRKGTATAEPEPSESAGSAAATVPASRHTARDDAAADRSPASAPAKGALGPAKSEVDAASQQTTTAAGEGGEEGAVDWMSCRLTGVRLVDPVVAADGESYERSALEAWLADKGPVSPATGGPLEHTLLLPNHALRGTLERLGTSTE